ncbi:hypothetical protein ZEAMMB73_Zm00001d013608 [Zea mays]|uniref:Uncharacterized protein n=1 Tax=Zea mays TaxID=4577 RepID=A0A1D6GKY2_MAIZE|nr:hypothetical protein ZEAMMB73_Zm00001d013608 [Zea mays]
MNDDFSPFCGHITCSVEMMEAAEWSARTTGTVGENRRSSGIHCTDGNRPATSATWARWILTPAFLVLLARS